MSHFPKLLVWFICLSLISTFLCGCDPSSLGDVISQIANLFTTIGELFQGGTEITADEPTNPPTTPGEADPDPGSDEGGSSTEPPKPGTGPAHGSSGEDERGQGNQSGSGNDERPSTPKKSPK